MGDGTVDRRRFIGLGLAAAGTAAVVGPGSWVERARLTWRSESGFPGRPNTLELHAPSLPEGAEVAITVEVLGPDPDHPVTTLESTTARVDKGALSVDVTMAYPYARRVAGRYSYRASVSWRGAYVQTLAPARYELIDWLPLS